MTDIHDSLQKISIKEISRTPFAYSLYVITLVLVGVIASQRIDAYSDKKAYEQRILILENTVNEERKIKDDVFKAYLVAKGVVDQIQKTVDSTAIINYKKK